MILYKRGMKEAFRLDLPLRLLLYIIGICLLALGTVLSARAMLGVGATPSFSYVLCEYFGWPLGNVTAVFLSLYVVIQLFITVKKDYVRILLQLPFSYLMAAVINIMMELFWQSSASILGRVFLLLLSICLTSVGVVFTVRTNIAPTAPDGLAACIAERWNKDFGFVKNIVDLSFVAASIAFCVLISHRLIGVGIGTVISAILTGRGVHLFDSILANFQIFQSND